MVDACSVLEPRALSSLGQFEGCGVGDETPRFSLGRSKIQHKDVLQASQNIHLFPSIVNGVPTLFPVEVIMSKDPTPRTFSSLWQMRSSLSGSPHTFASIN